MKTYVSSEPDPWPGSLRIEPARLEWQVIDDGVMGGHSRGRLRRLDDGLCFSGELSTANSGGFSSVRGALPDPRPGFLAVRLGIRGDGRRYQFRLRDSEDASAPAWRAFFETSGADETIELERSDFEAVVRGRRVEVFPDLAERSLQFAGLMLTSDREGPFRIEFRALDILFGGGRHG